MLVAFRCFLIHFSMGLWFLFLLPAITRTEKKKQQRSTIFRETAVETDRRPTQSLSPDEEACLLLLQSSPSYYFFMQRGKCHHKKGQPRCVHPVDRRFSAGLSASKREITGGEGTASGMQSGRKARGKEAFDLGRAEY